MERLLLQSQNLFKHSAATISLSKLIIQLKSLLSSKPRDIPAEPFLFLQGGTKRINQELQRKREQEGTLSGTAKAVARTALAVRGIISVEVAPLKRWPGPL